jgi:nitrogen fixation/metabolism regulation signal transduction histidine kinase
MISTIKNNRHKKGIMAMAATVLSFSCFAQEAAATAAPASGMNPIWWLIFGTMLILLVVVLILGNVLIGLTQIQINKAKQKAARIDYAFVDHGICFCTRPD